MITIRPIKKKDFSQIMQIERESFSDPYPLQLFQLLAEKDPSLFLVAIEKGRKNELPLGYIVADLEEQTGIKVGHIQSLAVKKEERRKRIGHKLLTTLIDCLRKQGCREVLLELRVSNYSAKIFYQNHGFQIIKRSRKYYQDGEDALVMLLNLEEQV